MIRDQNVVGRLSAFLYAVTAGEPQAFHRDGTPFPAVAGGHDLSAILVAGVHRDGTVFPQIRISTTASRTARRRRFDDAVSDVFDRDDLVGVGARTREGRRSLRRVAFLEFGVQQLSTCKL